MSEIAGCLFSGAAFILTAYYTYTRRRSSLWHRLQLLIRKKDQYPWLLAESKTRGKSIGEVIRELIDSAAKEAASSLSEPASLLPAKKVIFPEEVVQKEPFFLRFLRFFFSIIIDSVISVLNGVRSRAPFNPLITGSELRLFFFTATELVFSGSEKKFM